MMGSVFASEADQTSWVAIKLALGWIATILSFTIDKWLVIAMLVFTILQIVVLVRKEFFKKRGKRKEPQTVESE